MTTIQQISELVMATPALTLILAVSGALILLFLLLCWRSILKRLDQLQQNSKGSNDFLENELSRLRMELHANMRTEIDSNTQTVKNELESLQRRFYEHQQVTFQRESALSEKLLNFQKEQKTQGELLAAQSMEQLEKFRLMLEQQLQANLDKKLTQSFGSVAERLAQVHNRLGEMNKLAQGVGELQRVLNNVKSRGVWGEVQLEKLLDDILAPGQFQKNFKPHTNRSDIVEFAIRFPGHSADSVVWLPVDAKFPLGHYQALTDAYENGDTKSHESARKALQQQIKLCAKTISQKYINPPTTTNFAILFLPCESLYAEVLKSPGLIESLQIEYRVSISGPTTFAALLCSLQMGFRSLQLQESTTEVWNLLAKVRIEFGKFSNTLLAVQKKLHQASDQIEEVGKRSQKIQKQLKSVESTASDTSEETLDEVAN